MSDSPFLSLIIPTLNREEDLQRLLVSLGGQTRKDFEVIIVDQNQNDNLAKLNYQELFKLNVLVVKPIQKLNASAARNFGYTYARGRIITFPDDDCWYNSLTLNTVFEIFNSEDVDVLCGRAIDPVSKKSNSVFLRQSKLISKIRDIPKAGLEYTIFCKTNVFKGCKGFDENISPGSSGIFQAGEAMDYLFRVFKSGYKIFFNTDVCINHPYVNYTELIQLSPDIRNRIFGYSAGFSYALRKNHLPTLFAYYITRSVGALFLSLIKLDKSSIIKNWELLKGRWIGFVKT